MAISPQTPPTGAPENETSIISLIRQLAHEVPALVTKELALAKAEINESITTTKAGIAAVAGGAMVLFAGLIILLMAAVYALAMLMAPWLAALIVGVIVMIIGAIMLQAGKKAFNATNFTPERTVNSLQKDKEAIQRKVS